MVASRPPPAWRFWLLMSSWPLVLELEARQGVQGCVRLARSGNRHRIEDLAAAEFSKKIIALFRRSVGERGSASRLVQSP